MGGSGAGTSSDDGRNAWEAASLVCRIATVGLSLSSAIMTAASTKCLYRSDGSTAGTVSYSDYGSFKYSALANLLSAALQGLAIWLEVLDKEKWAKTVELIDKLVLALTSTSAPLLFAVDNITSCGGGRRSRNRGICDMAGSFCRQIRLASLPSLGSVGFSVAVQYTSWRGTVNSSEVAHTPGRRRARTSSPPASPPPPPGPAGAVVESTGSGGPGPDDGDGDVGRRDQNQGRIITTYKDRKGKGNSGEAKGADDGDEGGPKPDQKTTEIVAEEKKAAGRGEAEEDRRGETQVEGAADPRVPPRERRSWTDGLFFKAFMKYAKPKKKGNKSGEDTAVEVQEEIQVEEADPPVTPGGNVLDIRRTRGG
ncbi:unnamed protein product [Urochloa humidicola]